MKVQTEYLEGVWQRAWRGSRDNGELVEAILARKAALGQELVILTHH